MTFDTVSTYIKQKFDELHTNEFFVHLLAKNCQTPHIIESSFREIHTSPKHTTLKRENHTDTQLQLCAIDGGNATIYASSSLHVEYIKITSCASNDETTFQTQIYEFFCIINTNRKDGYTAILMPQFNTAKSTTNTNFFESIQTTYTFNFSDNLISDNPMQNISGLIRRLLELQLALHIKDTIEQTTGNELPITKTNTTTQTKTNITINTTTPTNKDLKTIIALDGPLKSHHEHETELLNKLLTSVPKTTTITTNEKSTNEKTTTENQNLHIIGICKTTQLLVSNAQTAQYYIQSVLPEQLKTNKAWYTTPLAIANDEEYTVCFAKLHAKSQYLFRIDIQKGSIEEQHLLIIFETLTQYSCDISFLGYPYQLIKADEKARVSNEEISYLQMRFYEEFDDLTQQQLLSMAKSSSAHQVLDKRRF
jgi:hypothetical protein